MIQTTIKVSGMACSMCEAHINDTIRGVFSVEKVSSSHSKGETVIVSKEPLDENALRAAIDATGYTAGNIRRNNIISNGGKQEENYSQALFWCFTSCLPQGVTRQKPTLPCRRFESRPTVCTI